MNINTTGAATEKCKPRQLKRSLEYYLDGHNFNKLTKRKRIIIWLILAANCGCRVTRFDSEIVGDHCLNTTISEIGRLDGIEVSRAETKRPTQFGVFTDCKEYWLNDENVEKAKAYLGIIDG